MQISIGTSLALPRFIAVADSGGDDVTWTNPDLTALSYDSVSFSVSSQETIPNALFFGNNGFKMYIAGNSGDDVNEYTLSTAWNPSTATYVRNFSVSAKETIPSGLFFKDDGTEMYIVGLSSDSVHQYSLSTAYNISTASFTASFSVSSEDSAPHDLTFKEDGTKMYVLGNTGGDINEYNLSTAWDVSTASYNQNFSISSQETNATGIFISPTGERVYIVGTSGNDVNEYTLSTAWDISTASFDRNASVSSQETSPRAVFFKGDGSKMYIVGSSSDTVFQYSV